MDNWRLTWGIKKIEHIVFEYFRLIKNKDIEQLIDLFADNAIIYEAFSRLIEGSKGKSAIES